MAETHEPKKETVRIKLPPSPPGSAPNSNGGNGDAVRINLPPGAPVLPGLGKPPPQPPSFPVPSIAEPVPSPLHTPSIAEPIVDSPLVPPAPPPAAGKTPPVIPSPGPKKETARISTMPEPKSGPKTVKMSKTQPLITAPEPSGEPAPVFIEPANAGETSRSIPVALGWVLLGISALIFIIQVWTYLS